MNRTIRIIIIFSFLIINSPAATAQLNWVNVDSLYQPLPESVHVFKTTDMLDGKPNMAYYVIADLKDKNIFFDADTTFGRRFTPAQFYKKNNQPLVVVNTTFFSFQTNQNLTTVIQNGKMLAYNVQSLTTPDGKDTKSEWLPFRSAIGIRKNRTADIAWLFTDTAMKWPVAYQKVLKPVKINSDKNRRPAKIFPADQGATLQKTDIIRKWKMQTAIGGCPVLLQDGIIKITNEEEMVFRGERINEKNPRTAMGYTKNNKLIILVVQGRFPGIAEGATLTQEAKMLQELGCWEALNLDGGGSSCMLVNGKETIKPSDATGQRAVPAVFIIKKSKN